MKGRTSSRCFHFSHRMMAFRTGNRANPIMLVTRTVYTSLEVLITMVYGMINRANLNM